MQPGKVAVGDIEVPAVVGNSQAPSQCANDTCSGLQLLSDPQNVDFRPYLQQVLAVVKRNWMTVIPDAAKEGRRGVVVIKFFIQRSGSVSTLSISATSGNGSMDRAAVAGMSMSNPFPPLPAGYKGDEIHLQMAFAYNPTR
jgi:TonB family protein